MLANPIDGVAIGVPLSTIIGIELWVASGLHRLTRPDLSSHDVRPDVSGQEPHGIKAQIFTPAMERRVQEAHCGRGVPPRHHNTAPDARRLILMSIPVVESGGGAGLALRLGGVTL